MWLAIMFNIPKNIVGADLSENAIPQSVIQVGD